MSELHRILGHNTGCCHRFCVKFVYSTILLLIGALLLAMLYDIFNSTQKLLIDNFYGSFKAKVPPKNPQKVKIAKYYSDWFQFDLFTGYYDKLDKTVAPFNQSENEEL